ncbi:MAG: hypothetical protein NVS2B7_09900 [Herpetosiphon sp.]
MCNGLITLGAGTALPEAERDTRFMVRVAADGSTLIDCGGRPYQQLLQAKVDPNRCVGLC